MYGKMWLCCCDISVDPIKNNIDNVDNNVNDGIDDESVNIRNNYINIDIGNDMNDDFDSMKMLSMVWML